MAAEGTGDGVCSLLRKLVRSMVLGKLWYMMNIVLGVWGVVLNMPVATSWAFNHRATLMQFDKRRWMLSHHPQPLATIKHVHVSPIKAAMRPLLFVGMLSCVIHRDNRCLVSMRI